MSQQARNNPEGEANQAATRDNRRDVFAAKMQAQAAVALDEADLIGEAEAREIYGDAE